MNPHTPGAGVESGERARFVSNRVTMNHPKWLRSTHPDLPLCQSWCRLKGAGRRRGERAPSAKAEGRHVDDVAALREVREAQPSEEAVPLNMVLSLPPSRVAPAMIAMAI